MSRLPSSLSLLLLAGIIGVIAPLAAETIPPAPRAFFTDTTRQIPSGTVRALNQRLADYERESSNQLLVAIYDRMDSDSSIQDYTYRVAESWRVGQGARNNGAVLFVFLGDRKMFMQVGYGLEGALPDVLAKRIIEDEILPRFRQGNIALGMTRGVDAMIAATRGEYTGNGRTAADGDSRRARQGFSSIFIIIIIGLMAVFGKIPRRRRYISGRGHYHHHTGWGSSGRGGGFGGGGGFSGGGGSFGGGGAGGSW